MEAGIRGASLPLYAYRLGRMLGALETSEELEEDKEAILQYAEDHFSEFQPDVDRKLAQALWGMWMKNIPENQQPSIFAEVRDSMQGNLATLVNEVYDNSVYSSKAA
jgi:hypothetical protein